MNGRVNPFESLDDFGTKSVSNPVEREQIDKIAESEGFPSRQPAKPAAASTPVRASNHYTTGRDRQINTKATQETKERLARLAARINRSQAEVLETALREYEERLSSR